MDEASRAAMTSGFQAMRPWLWRIAGSCAVAHGLFHVWLVWAMGTSVPDNDASVWPLTLMGVVWMLVGGAFVWTGGRHADPASWDRR